MQHERRVSAEVCREEQRGSWAEEVRLHSLEHVERGEEQEQDGQQQQLEQLEGKNRQTLFLSKNLPKKQKQASVFPAVRDGEEVQLADVFTGFSLSGFHSRFSSCTGSCCENLLRQQVSTGNMLFTFTFSYLEQFSYLCCCPER